MFVNTENADLFTVELSIARKKNKCKILNSGVGTGF